MNNFTTSYVEFICKPTKSFSTLRPGVSQVLLVSTDGDYVNYDETQLVREELLNDNVTIFSIGIKSAVQKYGVFFKTQGLCIVLSKLSKIENRKLDFC